MNIFPRHARDKHRENSKRRPFLAVLDWIRCGSRNAISTLCCYSKPNICQDRLGTNVGNVERKRLFCRARRTALVALQVLGKRGWLLVLVCRACPFVPYAPSNYIFGLSDVGALTFIVSSVRREKTRLCNEFSLCLSRACLGKNDHF